MKNLTIVLPIYEKDIEIVKKCIDYYGEFFIDSNLIVLDSGGGSLLKEISSYYEFNESLTLEAARKKGILMANTEFTLCLDVDTFLPKGYTEQAIKILSEKSDVAVVALEYEKIQGHLAFGTSVWKTKHLRALYNWKFKVHYFCECFYMWSRVREAKLRIETIPMRAVHLKKIGN